MGQHKQIKPSKEPVFFEQLAALTLLFQIAATALYFNPYFTNPLVNKYLVAQSAAVVAWFFYGLHCIQVRRITLGLSPYFLPAALLLVWAGIRSTPSASTAAPHNFYVFATILASFPLWVTLFLKRRYRLWFVGTACFVGGVMLVGCLRQLLMENPRFDWSFFPAMTLSTGTYERQRLGAFLGHNNASASYLLVFAILTGYLWYRFRRYSAAAVAGIAIVAAVGIIYLSGSRGVALGLVSSVGFLLTGFLIRRHASDPLPFSTLVQANKKLIQRSAAAIGVFGVLFLIVLMSSSTVQTRGANLTKRFLISKEELLSGTYPRVWLMSLLMVKDYPLAGVGFSAWPNQYPTYQERWFTQHPQTKIGPPPLETHTQRAHNDYFQTWAELGVPGLVAMLWLLGLHGVLLYRLLRKRPVPVLGLFTGAATVAVLTRCFFAFPFHEAADSCLFLGNLALFSSVMSTRRYQYALEWMPKKSPAQYGAIAGVAGIFMILSYPIWAYIMGDFTLRLYGRHQEYAQMVLNNSALSPEERESQYSKHLESAPFFLKLGVEQIPYEGKYAYLMGNELLAEVEQTATGVIDPLGGNQPNPQFDQAKAMDALAYYQQALQSYSLYSIHARMGRVYELLWENTIEEKYYDLAVQNYQKAVRIMPVYEEGYAHLILLQAKKGQEPSLAWHTEARYPGFVNRTLLPMAANARHPKEASLLYQVAALATPGNPEVFTNAIAFYYQINRPDLVRNTIVGLAAFQPDTVLKPAITRLYTELLNQGKAPEALALARILQQKPNLQVHGDLWFYSGLVAWLAGDPWETVHCWQTAHEQGIPLELLNPSFQQALEVMLMLTISM